MKKLLRSSIGENPSMRKQLSLTKAAWLDFDDMAPARELRMCRKEGNRKKALATSNTPAPLFSNQLDLSLLGFTQNHSFREDFQTLLIFSAPLQSSFLHSLDSQCWLYKCTPDYEVSTHSSTRYFTLLTVFSSTANVIWLQIPLFNQAQFLVEG